MVRRGEYGGAGKFFAIFLGVVAFVGMAGALGFLASDLNHRKFRMHAKSGKLVIERGRFLPIGFEPYSPDNSELAQAYAPMPLPNASTHVAVDVFDDRTDLDRALFGLLAGWIDTLLEQPDEEAFAKVREYVDRCERLPGLSEEQREELRRLRADIAYRSGRQLLQGVVERLRRARREFEIAIELGSTKREQAAKWVDELDRRIQSYSDTVDSTQASPEPGVEPEPEPEPKPDDPTQTTEKPKWRL